MSNELPRFGISLSLEQGREMLRKGAAMEADGCYMVVGTHRDGTQQALSR